MKKKTTKKSATKKKSSFMDNLVTKEIKIAEKKNLMPKCYGTFEIDICLEVFCKNYPECKGKV